MYWLKDARETLDVLLTYGDVDDPLFAHMLEEYRAVARVHGRSTEFEHLVAEMMTLKSPHHAGTTAPGY